MLTTGSRQTLKNSHLSRVLGRERTKITIRRRKGVCPPCLCFRTPDDRTFKTYILTVIRDPDLISPAGIKQFPGDDGNAGKAYIVDDEFTRGHDVPADVHQFDIESPVVSHVL